MKKAMCFAVLVSLFASQVQAGEKIVLVDDGVPKAAIVLGSRPVKAARFAAAEMQHVVKLITGANLPIVAERPSSGVAVFIGCGSDEKFEREEYSVRFSGGDIILRGNDAPDYGPFNYADGKTFPQLKYCYRSTTYAVYDFLEKWCGVRFYGFCDDGIAYEERKTLAVEAKGGYARQPAMDAMRVPHFGGYPKGLGARVTQRELDLLRLRWRANAMFGEVNHSVYSIYFRYYKPSKVPARAKLFIDSRPDYFAKGYEGRNAPSALRKHDYPGDKDIPPQLCASSEGPVEFFADEACRIKRGEKVEGTMASRPVMEGQPFYYPVQEDDSCEWCKCDKCVKRTAGSTYSQVHFDWVNRVAKSVREKDSSIGVGTLAYSDTLEPPEGLELEPNVLVQTCLSLQSWFHPYVYKRQHGAYKEWVAKTARRNPLCVWLYFLAPWSEAKVIHKYGDFFPVFFPRHTGKFFKEFAADGVRGFFAEIMPRYHLLEGYVAAKIADDPSLDPDALVDEHYRLHYGAAGEAMKRFSDQLEKESYDIANYTDAVRAKCPKGSYVYCLHSERDNWHLGSAERVARLDALMSAAKAAARTPRERAHIDDFCQRVWNTAVDGRRDFEVRERQRSVARPFVVAAWGEGAEKRKSSDFVTLYNKKAKTPVQFALSSDAQRLYLDFEEKGPDAVNHSDLNMWLNGVEMFIADTQDAKNGYYQLAIGPSGETKAIRSRIVAGVWRHDALESPKVVSTATKDGWRFSLELPFDVLDGVRPGETFYMNVFRTRRWEGGESLAWSPIFCESYIVSVHRLGLVFTSAPTQYGEYCVKLQDWGTSDTKKGLKSGEIVKYEDGVLTMGAGEDANLAVLQHKAFPSCHIADRVVFEFEARGGGGWAAAAIYLLTGRQFGAGLVKENIAVSREWSKYRVELAVSEVNAKYPPTVYRPGFLLGKNAQIEVRNLKITAINR